MQSVAIFFVIFHIGAVIGSSFERKNFKIAKLPGLYSTPYQSPGSSRGRLAWGAWLGESYHYGPQWSCFGHNASGAENIFLDRKSGRRPLWILITLETG